MSSEIRELVRKWKFNLRLLGPDVARRVLESCISDVEALLARTEAGAKCDHAWQPDSDVMNARYCPKCDVTQTIPKKTTHPQDASGDAAKLSEVERKAVTDLMESQVYEAGDVDDEPPRIDEDEDAYWAYHNYHGLRKLLAMQAKEAK